MRESLSLMLIGTQAEPKGKLPAVQCWHCGKFRKATDISVSRDWETGEWVDAVCSVCRESQPAALREAK